MDPLSRRVARRYAAQVAAKPPPSAEEFATGFFKRHPNLHRFAPKKVLDSTGSGGRHPEASQQGDDILLYPKFWKLAPKIRDYVFTHELGHWVLNNHSLAKLIKDLESLGVDAWDTTKLPFSEPNMDEAFAESFAVHFTTPNELKERYPEWAAVVQKVVG